MPMDIVKHAPWLVPLILVVMIAATVMLRPPHGLQDLPQAIEKPAIRR